MDVSVWLAGWLAGRCTKVQAQLVCLCDAFYTHFTLSFFLFSIWPEKQKKERKKRETDPIILLPVKATVNSACVHSTTSRLIANA